jgi:integrase
MENPNEKPSPKQTATTETNQETRIQDNKEILSPKTSVLIQPRLRAPSARLLYSNNINADVKGKIINTLLKLKNNGLEEQTVKIVGYYLNHLAVNVNLENPEKVKEFIANKNVNSGFKGNLVKAYNYYALVNNIIWEGPRYRWEQNKPKIPSEETLNKIIASCGWKYSVVFTLLKETRAMPKELSEVILRDIDFDREPITIRGRKGHVSRTIKLKPNAIAMLKTYLAKIGSKEHPFPLAGQMTKAWIKYKRRLSTRLAEPAMFQIRLYDLRHYQACRTYYQTKDVFYTKQKLGWKKLETALFYLQCMDFGSEEYHSATAKTVEEAAKLIEQGFDFICEVDGVKLFRKRK